MNVFTIGILVSFAVYLLIGVIVGRKVKTVEDYYVAGRRAPVILIVGSLVASYTSTGAFLGDAGEMYSGGFMVIVVVATMQVVGYVYGGLLFGRYLRRSRALTVPEFFGNRFNSRRLRCLAGVTTIIAVCAYLLSVMQGVSTLMATVTGIDYQICVVIAWLTFTVFTVVSGSRGVLITDTLMFLIFTSMAVVGALFIASAAGGWLPAMENLASMPESIIGWGGSDTYLYGNGAENFIWAIVYGIVWMLVIMVSPWQSSRYLMAKNEHVVLRSSVWAAIGVCAVEIIVGFAAIFVYTINPGLEDGTTVLIWAAMNVMPTFVGVLMLTGILAAGISSGSTFLSLVGFSAVNDIAEQTSDKNKLSLTRIAMVVAGLVALALAFFNPPAIFWIMYFGSTVLACSWGPVAIASIWSKKVSERGAFWGMLLGFAGCFVTKLYTQMNGITLPIYLDPFFIGVALCVAALVVGSLTSKPSKAESDYLAMIRTVPEDEKRPADIAITKRTGYIAVAFGVVLAAGLIFGYSLIVI